MQLSYSFRKITVTLHFMMMFMSALFSLFCMFFYLGCISFGGPTAHIALFQQELIEKRKWMTTPQYLQWVAICQFLPGPSSSQVGMVLGFSQKGYLGAFVAWLGFTLPSAILLTSFALGMLYWDILSHIQFVHGLKIAACAIVAYAVLTMLRQICTSFRHYVLMLIIAIPYVSFSSILPQICWIMAAGMIGLVYLPISQSKMQVVHFNVSQRMGYLCLTLFITLLLLLGVLAKISPQWALVDIFYHAGAWVFGGGHVVLPLLEDRISGQNLLPQDVFLAGYGVVQSMPGPLFNFASYLGAMLLPQQPLYGAMLATLAIFLPAALILFAAIPFMQKLTQLPWLGSFLSGVNVAVLAILIATLVNPLLLTGLMHWWDGIVIVFLLALLHFKIVPIWSIVLISCGFYFVML